MGVGPCLQVYGFSALPEEPRNFTKKGLVMFRGVPWIVLRSPALKGADDSSQSRNKFVENFWRVDFYWSLTTPEDARAS
jgi:hypothetical protein